VIFLIDKSAACSAGRQSKWGTDLEIAEERVDEEIDDDEWRKDGVQNTHEDESSLEPMSSEASATHQDLRQGNLARTHPCTRSFLFRSRTNSFLT
jgi:hypothetical protein